MNEQQKLMRRINAYRFSLWELHLFLDSHPNNCDAAKKMDETRKKLNELVAEYEAAYGPIHETSANTSRWAWITGPWPWETGMEDDD